MNLIKTVSLLLLVLVIAAARSAVMTHPVDLSGKKGVVDPADLKKLEPKPPKVQQTAPPPPPPPHPRQSASTGSSRG